MENSSGIDATFKAVARYRCCLSNILTRLAATRGQTNYSSVKTQARGKNDRSESTLKIVIIHKKIAVQPDAKIFKGLYMRWHGVVHDWRYKRGKTTIFNGVKNQRRFIDSGNTHWRKFPLEFRRRYTIR